MARSLLVQHMMNSAHSRLTVRISFLSSLAVLFGVGLVSSCGDNPVDSKKDTTRPTVVSVTPIDFDSTVSIGASVSATFSEMMLAATMVDGVLTLSPAVAGDISYSDRTVTFTPSNGLDTNVAYTATVATSAADTAGNKLAGVYTWDFKTYLDIFPPTVAGTVPADHDSTATVNTTVAVTFNEAMNTATLGAASFQIVPSVSGVFEVSSTGMIFTPDLPLDTFLTYTATITTVAADLAGNNVETDYSWEFYTSRDTQAPTAFLLSPADGAVAADSTLIEVVASDNDRIGLVEFYIDGAHIVSADDDTFPYEYVWDASAEEIASEHTIFARAVDEAGNGAWSDTAVVSYLWKLGATDFYEPGIPRNIKNVFFRNTATQVQFRIETWDPWTEYNDLDNGIDVVIYIDSDQNPNTGDRFTDSGTINIGDIGAEIQMIIGFHGLYLQHWLGSTWGPIEGVEDLIMSSDTNVFEVALSRQRFDDPAEFDVVVANYHVTTFQWDWVPDSGHIDVTAESYYPGSSSALRRPSTAPAATGFSATANPFN